MDKDAYMILINKKYMKVYLRMEIMMAKAPYIKERTKFCIRVHLKIINMMVKELYMIHMVKFSKKEFFRMVKY